MWGVSVGTRALLVFAITASLAACHKVEARMPTPPPPVLALDIPTPPARVTIPVDIPDGEPPPAPSQPAASTARPRPDASSTARPPVTSSPQIPAAPDTPGPSLPATADNAVQERRTLSLIDEATRHLQTVPYRDLPPQAKAQYDSAMSFIKNARIALQNRNYMYAEQLATKAAAVARELGKS